MPGPSLIMRIDREPIAVRELADTLADERAGALVTFEGWVRNRNEGRAVTRLHYEVYDPLALSEGRRVLVEAAERFELLDARCHHRAGDLELGDAAVWVGVISRHRAAAFDACRYIIDEAKARLPIWKKEFYVDGDSGWVNCATRGPGAGQAQAADVVR